MYSPIAAMKKGWLPQLAVSSIMTFGPNRPCHSDTSDERTHCRWPRPDLTALAKSMAKVGGAWLSFFGNNEIDAVLRQAGFSSVVHFGPKEAQERYLRGRTDGSRLPAYFRLAKAINGSASAQA